MTAGIHIADIPIRLNADRSWLREALTRTVIGLPADDATAVASIELRHGIGTVPDRLPDDEHYGFQLWVEAEGAVVRCKDVVLEVIDDRAQVFVPSTASTAVLEPLTNLALCWLLARHQRYVIHAGAIGREDDAFLVFGDTGAGKSTTVFAALEAGWWALSDDLVVVAPTDAGIQVYGVHQEPTAPLEIGGRLASSARPLGDPRARGSISWDLLDPHPHGVRGCLLVGHSRLSGGEITTIPGHQVLPIVMRSFAACADLQYQAPFLPVAAELSRFPSWSLGHSCEPTGRRQAVMTHLERIA